MANKRLSDNEAEQLKEMVIAGASPEDLATHFGIAISSVHNYKNRFKAAGIEFPSVRGKRPSGAVNGQGMTDKNSHGVTNQFNNGHGRHDFHNDLTTIRYAESSPAVNGQFITLLLNNIPIAIPKNATNVSVTMNGNNVVVTF